MATLAEREEIAVGRMVKFITFGLGMERFAISIEEVKEIIANYEVVPLPKAPDFIEGIISLRGDIIPVVEMRKRFEMEGREEDKEETRIIVLEMEAFAVGIQVDKVYEVLKMDESAIEPPPKLVAGLKADYLEGVCEVDSKLTIILNLEEIFSSTEKIIMQEGVESAVAEAKGKGSKPARAKKKEVAKKPESPASTPKVTASGQISLRGKSYYVGKKYKGEEVSLEEAGGKLSVLLGGEKIKEFDV